MVSISNQQKGKSKFQKGITLGDLIRRGVSQSEIKRLLGFEN